MIDHENTNNGYDILTREIHLLRGGGEADAVDTADKHPKPNWKQNSLFSY